jgi:hypothetical protein
VDGVKRIRQQQAFVIARKGKQILQQKPQKREQITTGVLRQIRSNMIID